MAVLTLSERLACAGQNIVLRLVRSLPRFQHGPQRCQDGDTTVSLLRFQQLPVGLIMVPRHGLHRCDLARVQIHILPLQAVCLAHAQPGVLKQPRPEAAALRVGVDQIALFLGGLHPAAVLQPGGQFRQQHRITGTVEVRTPIGKDAGQHAFCVFDGMLALALHLQVGQIPTHRLGIDVVHHSIAKIGSGRSKVLLVGVHRTPPHRLFRAPDILFIRHRHRPERVALFLRVHAFQFIRQHRVLIFALRFGLGLAIEHPRLWQTHRTVDADAAIRALCGLLL